MASKSSSTKKSSTDIPGEATRVSPTAADRPDAPKEASLVQIYGPSLGQRYVLDRAQLTMGRDAQNDIVLDTDNVSRAHARVRLHEGQVIFEDLGSTNGSLVNDEEAAECVLHNGDIIKIGSVILKFISSGNAEALYHEEIYKMTIQDNLTGIANRRAFAEFLDRELARAARYERPLTLVLLDLDHFKQINDTYGHLAGDFVLRRVAAEVRSHIRREELFARYGGEEFAVVMPETDAVRATTFAEKLRGLIEALELEFDGQRIPVTLSAGVAQRSGTVREVEELVKAADTALYEAKGMGRNRVVTAAEAS